MVCMCVRVCVSACFIFFGLCLGDNIAQRLVTNRNVVSIARWWRRTKGLRRASKHLHALRLDEGRRWSPLLPEYSRRWETPAKKNGKSAFSECLFARSKYEKESNATRFLLGFRDSIMSCVRSDSCSLSTY